MQTDRLALHRIWMGALACFVLAGATGGLFRIGQAAGGLPGGLQFENVRHAHSHLMYFGWVTPALMALVAAHLPAPGRLMKTVMRVVLVLAALSYAPFLLYGYGPATVGPTRLPLSVMVAGLNILAWYVFAALYVQRRQELRPSPARAFWDAAVALLVVASLGAWALGIVQALGLEDPFWFAAALHLFLDLFADGWLLLGVLGLAVATMGAGESALLQRGRRLLVAGLPFTFLLGVPVELVPPGLRFVGSAGGAVSSAGLLCVAAALWRDAEVPARRVWIVPLGLLVVKAGAQLGLAVPAVAEWAYGANLRILYLHVLLLGVVTLGLLAAARCRWGWSAVPGRRYVTAAALFLLATLLPLTGLWPLPMGRGALYSAVLGAVAPVVAVAVLLVRSVRQRRSERERTATQPHG